MAEKKRVQPIGPLKDEHRVGNPDTVNKFLGIRPEISDVRSVRRMSTAAPMDQRMHFKQKVAPDLEKVSNDWNNTGTDPDARQRALSDVMKIIDKEASGITPLTLGFLSNNNHIFAQEVYAALARREINRKLEESEALKNDPVAKDEYKKLLVSKVKGFTPRTAYVWLRFFNIHNPNGSAYIEQRGMAGKLASVDTTFPATVAKDPDLVEMKNLLTEPELKQLRMVVKSDLVNNGNLLIEQDFRDASVQEFVRHANEFKDIFASLLTLDRQREIELLIEFAWTNLEAQTKYQQGPGYNVNAKLIMPYRNMFELLDRLDVSKSVGEMIGIMNDPDKVELAVIEAQKLNITNLLDSCVVATGLTLNSVQGQLARKTIETIGFVPLVKRKGSLQEKLAAELSTGKGLIGGIVTPATNRFSNVGIPFFTYVKERPSKARYVTFSDGRVEYFGGRFGGNLIEHLGDDPEVFFKRSLTDQLAITAGEGKESLNDYFYQLSKLKDLDGKLYEIVKFFLVGRSSKEFFASLVSLRTSSVMGFLSDARDVRVLLSPLLEFAVKQFAGSIRNGDVESEKLITLVLELEALYMLGNLDQGLIDSVLGNDQTKTLGSKTPVEYSRLLVANLAGISPSLLESYDFKNEYILNQKFPGLRVFLDMNPEFRNEDRAIDWLLRYTGFEPVVKDQDKHILQRKEYSEINLMEREEYLNFCEKFEHWINRDGSTNRDDKSPRWDIKLPYGDRYDQIRRIVARTVFDLMQYGPEGFRNDEVFDQLRKGANQLILPFHPYIIWFTSRVTKVTNLLFERKAPKLARSIEDMQLSTPIKWAYNLITTEKFREVSRIKYLKFLIKHPHLAGWEATLKNLGDLYLFRMPYIAGPTVDPVAFLDMMHGLIGERSFAVATEDDPKKRDEVMNYLRNHFTVYKTIEFQKSDGSTHRVAIGGSDLENIVKGYKSGGKVIEVNPADVTKLIRVGSLLQKTTNKGASVAIDAVVDPFNSGEYILLKEFLNVTDSNNNSQLYEVKEAVKDFQSGEQYITLEDIVENPHRIPKELIDTVEGISVGTGVVAFPEPAARPQFVFNDTFFYTLEKMAKNSKFFWARIARRSISNNDSLRTSVLYRKMAEVLFNHDWYLYFDKAADVSRTLYKLNLNNEISDQEEQWLRWMHGAVGEHIKGTENEMFIGQPAVESLGLQMIGEVDKQLDPKTAKEKLEDRTKQLAGDLASLAASISPIAHGWFKLIPRFLRIKGNAAPFIIGGVATGLWTGSMAATAVGLGGAVSLLPPIALGVGAYWYFSDGDKKRWNFHASVRKFVLEQYLRGWGTGLDGLGFSLSITNPKEQDYTGHVYEGRMTAVGSGSKSKK